MGSEKIHSESSKARDSFCGSWSLFTPGERNAFVLFQHARQPLENEKNTRGEHMKKEYDFSKGKRGALDPLPSGKTRITIRIDNDVLEWFHNIVESKGGGNYQTLMNHALREYIKQQGESLEEIVRRLVREEVRRVD